MAFKQILLHLITDDIHCATTFQFIYIHFHILAYDHIDRSMYWYMFQIQ